MKDRNCKSAPSARSRNGLSIWSTASSLLNRVSKRGSLIALIPAKLRSSQGNALVEIAVTMPIVFMLLTGVFSLTLALSQKVELTESVADGGRVLAVERGDTDPCKVATQTIDKTMLGLDSSKLTLSYNLNGTAYGSGVTTCAGPNSGANTDMVQGKTATITASYPCLITVYGSPLINCTLGTQISEVIQ